LPLASHIVCVVLKEFLSRTQVKRSPFELGLRLRLTIISLMGLICLSAAEARQKLQFHICTESQIESTPFWVILWAVGHVGDADVPVGT